MALTTKNSCCVGSLNCQHYNDLSIDFMKLALTKCNFLFVQEHCLYLTQLHKLNAIGNISYHGTSAMDETKCNIGRPHGGCAIIWHNDLNCNVNPILCENKRICCVSVTFANELTALFINVYMPCDERFSGNSHDELQSTLDDVLYIVNEHKYDMIIFGGDLNADFSRHTPHVNTVKLMLQTAHLISGIEHVLSTVKYTYESKSCGSRSLIDHLCVSDNVFHTMTAYHTVQSVDNNSDHDLLICSLDVADVKNCMKEHKVFKARPAWYKATSENISSYMESVNNMLQDISVPYNVLNCRDLKCIEHSNDIEAFYNDIIKSCLQSENLYIPLTGSNAVKCIPGWNDHVKTKRLESLYFHELWKAAGRPLQGDIANNMRQSRKSYHYAVRYCKKQQTLIKAQKMAESLCNSQSRDFWREVKLYKQSNNTVTSRVDNATDPSAIADIFYNKFKSVYTSVPYDEADLHCLASDIDKQVHVEANTVSHNDYECISVNKIVKLAKQLKSGKHDGNDGPTSDCLINGPHRLYVCLSLLFKLMVTHCYIPKHLLVGTMFPLPKVKGLTNVSDKYRAITLSSCILKLFDLLILTSERNVLYTDVLQFGFKPECSTTLCSSMLNEVSRLFIANKSNVFSLLLDATKAFDRVNYTKLFRILLNRGINALFVKLLLKLYTSQTLRVNWQNHLSASFTVTNGVRQGGVLSPILFIVYMDELLQKLRKSGYGCYIGPHFLGALAYADDIVLVSPTKNGLKSMANICEKYSSEYNIVFNASKSQYCIFRNSNVTGNTKFEFNNVLLNESSVITHLGHKIFCNVKAHNLEGILAGFYKQYNIFKCNFGSLPSSVQASLFHKYCSSFYGSLLMPFSNLKGLQVAWRKCLRQVWRLPYRTHCAIVNCLSTSYCDLHMFVNRFVKFFLNLYNHNVDVVRYMCYSSLSSSGSILYENLLFCCKTLDCTKDELLAKASNKSLAFVRQYCFSKCKASHINACTVIELCNVRDQLCECVLSNPEVICIINDLCLN